MSASTYPITDRRIEDYEAFVEGRTHLDHLRGQLSGFYPDLNAKVRRANQGTLIYDAWDPNVGLVRAVELTRENAHEVGFLVEIQEIVIDPNMIFILMKVWA